MKNSCLPLALVLSASLLRAQPKPTLSCNDHNENSRRASYCEMREQTVAAAGGIITVDASPNGGISLKGWDRADVLVRAQVRTSAPTDGEARDLARMVNIQTVGAQIRSDGPSHNNDHDRSWSVSYEVFVPTRSSANLQTVNGGINVSDVLGGMEFKTTNGGINLHRVNGTVRGQTTNGGVNIELAGDRWDGQGMEIRTTNGGVNLVVPASFSAQLEAETHNGGIHSDLPMATMPQSGRPPHHVSTALGAGGAMLKITTTNGGVNIKTAGGIKRL
jgi:DUF4097 and DUF4098 domain-containing protein YvlB